MPDFSFLIASDLHFVDDNCRPFFQRMVTAMKQVAPAPAFLGVLGDLGEEGTAAELSAMRDILAATGIPTRIVCGNHDWNRDGDRSTFTRIFPGPTNYTFEQGEWQFIAMDSSAGRAWDGTAVPETSLAWLDQTLATLDRERPTVLLTHFPLGEGVRYRVTNAEAVLDRFRGHNLRHVFNGHFHGTSECRVGSYAITTSPCCSAARRNHDGTTAKGFVLCRTNGDTIDRRFVPMS